MNVYRYEENPLLKPADVKPHREDFEVIGVFNAGVAKYQDEIILLLRVAERPASSDPAIVKATQLDRPARQLRILEFRRDDPKFDYSDPRVIQEAGSRRFQALTSISYLRIARSKDGRRFTVDDQPFLFPETEYETLGIEDPRITQVGDTYYIVFTSVSTVGVAVGMASTRDFRHVQRHGLIFAPENKDVLLFPEKINGKYYALHRPVPKGLGAPEIWIAESDNLLYWGNHRFLLGLRENRWETVRLGAGAVPIKTEKGWLELYHAADQNNRYCMGAVLLDLERPWQVIARSEQPILEPEADYERAGFFGNVVFSCGALVEGDTIKMYYGVSDDSIACAELSLREILEALTFF
ncbi:BtaManbiosPhlase [Effusibacillus pohliae]|uniref:BtaManbiosPhlase n=1 Tax=Effusibacillus pohliae TaxID=232270 RepID=UPI00036039F5|nr:glycoside hydrolase family 130 protein [Effusibacillus pohliae]